MKASDYVEILELELIRLYEEFEGEEVIFQQDNAPIPRHPRQKLGFGRRKSKFYLGRRAVRENPIENLWGVLARQICRKYAAKNF